MISDVLVPQMGESVLEGTILEWKVNLGDRVVINQALVELMTDKVNVEIPAEIEGVLTAQFVKEGEVVPVGARIATIDDGKEGEATATGSTSTPEPAKATPAIIAASLPTTEVPPLTITVEKGTGPMGAGKLSPKVRMMIREYGLDPATIMPTGKDGRVKADDVMRAVNQRSSAAGYTADPIPAPPLPAWAGDKGSLADSGARSRTVPAEPMVKVVIPVFALMPANERETRKPLAGARKMIADHMTASEATSVHVTTFEDIDLTELAAWRDEVKGTFLATYGAKLTYLPFVMKACCVALREFPTINASLTDKEIIVKNYYNIGVAVARDEGLIVPVVKHADRKSIVELAVEIAQLGEKARTNKLMPDDVADGTFTLTNAGMFGATASTPIISQPQVAILGIHAIAKRPWVVDNEIVIRNISTFGMSFDHRLIDGHTAVQFLHRVHEYLADVKKMMLNLR